MFPFFVLIRGTSSLRDRKRLYHGLSLWWKCLQVFDYKESFNSWSSMLSNDTWSILQELLKLDNHKVFESQAGMESLELQLKEFVSAMPPLRSHWTLNWWERNPTISFGGEKSLLFLLVIGPPLGSLRETNLTSFITS